MWINLEEFNTFSVFGRKYQLPLDESEIETRERILLTATICFAVKGFSSVSMRDIAQVLEIQPSSLYNHFKSKGELWDEVLKHTNTLYMLYFNHLDEALDKAQSFSEILSTIFHEPKLMANTFTCYAFCMVQSEQFRDDSAGGVFRDIFLKFSIDFFRNRFEKCIADGMVKPFDTNIVATMIMHSVLISLELNVQQRLGHELPYDPASTFADLERFILRATGCGS